MAGVLLLSVLFSLTKELKAAAKIFAQNFVARSAKFLALVVHIVDASFLLITQKFLIINLSDDFWCSIFPKLITQFHTFPPSTRKNSTDTMCI